MKIMFVLKSGGAIQWDVPAEMADINFGVVVKAIRADGFFMAPEFYVSFDCIASMALLRDEKTGLDIKSMN